MINPERWLKYDNGCFEDCADRVSVWSKQSWLSLLLGDTVLGLQLMVILYIRLNEIIIINIIIIID